MKRLLGSAGALVTAWFVVAALLAALAALVFLQPPPPGSEPVTVALNPPAAEGGLEEAAPEPAQDAPPAEPQAPPEAPPQEPPAPEAPTLEAPAPEAPAPEAPAPETPAPEAPAPETPAPEAPAPEAPAPETPAPETPAPEAPGSEAPAPEPPADQTPAAAPADAPSSPPPPLTPPEPPVQPPPPAPETEDPAAEGPAEPAAGAEDSDGSRDEAVVTIPGIPPAPEQLPYWERYRQPFNMDDERPRIAVVMTGLGLSDSATKAAIERLPASVTLSFSPYARELERWIALARSHGHEVLLDLPMEPTTFPNEDPGPQALLTGLSTQENLDRLDWVLGRGSAYVGVAGAMGSRFTATRDAVEPVLRELHDRGLLIVDRRTTEQSLVPQLADEIGLPHAVNSRSVDERQASRVAIDARLAQVERVALTEGVAVAMAQPYPVTLDRLVEWTAELTGRGFAVAPISAVVGLQETP